MVATDLSPADRAASRVKSFAGFFKNYMGVSSLVVAALPIPASELKLIPMFDVQRHYLSIYTSLFCFLVFAYIFFSRHLIGRLLFESPHADVAVPKDDPMSMEWYRRTVHARQMKRGYLQLLPLLLIVASLTSALSYHSVLNGAVHEIKSRHADARGRATESVLKETSEEEIAGSIMLILSYLGIFIAAEAAFVLMATKEYLLDVLGLHDDEIIRRGGDSPKAASAYAMAEGPEKSG